MKVEIIEMGPRDGLQNEKTPIPVEAKLAFIERLVAAGLREIEATSFVSPKWVPQLGDAAELWPLLPEGPLFSALVPNRKGLERALELGVKRIALFTAVSDAFTQKNINMTVAESLVEFGEVASLFREAVPGGFIRGYVSTAFQCPFSGRVEPERVLPVVESLLKIGVDEISIGDTVGMASPTEVRRLDQMLRSIMDKKMLAWHFHDTRGTALANVVAALEGGSTRFDASAAGLGGCPYAPGAAGNLSTEDLVYFCLREGIDTGVDLGLLAEASVPILQALGRAPISKAQQAVLAEAARSGHS